MCELDSDAIKRLIEWNRDQERLANRFLFKITEPEFRRSAGDIADFHKLTAQALDQLMNRVTRLEAAVEGWADRSEALQARLNQ